MKILLSFFCVILIFVAFSTAEFYQEDQETQTPAEAIEQENADFAKDDEDNFAAADEENDGSETELAQLEDQFLDSATNEKDDEDLAQIADEYLDESSPEFQARPARAITRSRTRRSTRRSPASRTRRTPARRRTPSRRSPSRSRRRPGSNIQCPIIAFPCALMPNVCKNIKNGFKAGKPSMLTRITMKSQIASNRRNSGCRKLGPKPGYNCDEYPFASSRQGGRGAVVKLVPIRENSKQGGMLSAFYRKHKIGNGGCFKVRLI